ncbi:unnamed protein product [Prunus armeniaca]
MLHTSTGLSLGTPKAQLEPRFSFGSMSLPHYTQHTAGPPPVTTQTPTLPPVPHDQYTHLPRHFDNDIIHHIKPTAPTFDGRGDPTIFLDWVQAMEDYFAWYNLTDAHKLRIAKMTLRGAARQYWNSMEEQLYQFGWPPVTLWDEMKLKLREQYVPTVYRQQLFDQLWTISQGNLTPATANQTLPTTGMQMGFSGPSNPTAPPPNKGPAVSTSSRIECFHCHAKGHIASRCLRRNLTINTPDSELCEIVEPLEGVYDPDINDCRPSSPIIHTFSWRHRC